MDVVLESSSVTIDLRRDLQRRRGVVDILLQYARSPLHLGNNTFVLK